MSIKVTDEFIDIYRNFNISNQVERLKNLSRREIYLMILLCIDEHSEEDEMVMENLHSFASESMDLYNLQSGDDKNINSTLKALAEETDDKYIDVQELVDLNNTRLPKPYKKTEVRDIKIDLIMD